MVFINVEKNRNTVKWTKRELSYRLAWSIAGVFFSLIPRRLWGFRRILLRVFGASIGSDVHIYPSVKIFMPKNLKVGDRAAIGASVHLYNLGSMSIGEDVTISQGAYLCGGDHDLRSSDRALIKAEISVKSSSWICAKAIIGPQVIIGEGSVVGLGAVVSKDVPDRSLVVGNPARVVKIYD